MNIGGELASRIREFPWFETIKHSKLKPRAKLSDPRATLIINKQTFWTYAESQSFGSES